MTRHRKIAIGLGLVMGAIVGVGFGLALAQRDWDDSPFLGRHQPVIGGVLMGLAVAVLFSCSCRTASGRSRDASIGPSSRR